MVGIKDGDTVGTWVGRVDGALVAPNILGEMDGIKVGCMLGADVGMEVGILVGR